VLRSLGGTAPLLVICALLFAEEAGVPIPVAPGEAVLLGAGLLIAAGTVPFWLAMPGEFIAVLAGALTGYAWSRAIGVGRLRQLADRLGAGKPFDRVAERLHEAGIVQIAGSRLRPGGAGARQRRVGGRGGWDPLAGLPHHRAPQRRPHRWRGPAPHPLSLTAPATLAAGANQPDW
jgi:hypothetical protein